MTHSPDIDHRFANRHIPAFLKLEETNVDESASVQVVRDGRSVKAENFFRERLSLRRPVLIRDSPESIGMKVLKPKEGRKAVSVRDVADIVGHGVPLSVIDVENQEELEGWTFADLVDYFEDEDRSQSMLTSDQAANSPNHSHTESPSRTKRKAALVCLEKTNNRRVLNQISFEFSATALAEHVKSPLFVREIDWIDHAWPPLLKSKRQYPAVQYYCLTSAAGAYTDFHLDFGGTSVWYHVLSGSKEFCLIPPTEENLNIYEKWLCSKDQSIVFLPDILLEDSGVIKITMLKDQTLIIPSGWIHAVYTPQDSLVFGGNFMHGLAIATQIQTNCIEVRTRVLERFRFPHFVPLQFYALGMYYEKVGAKEISRQELDSLPILYQAVKEWWNVHSNEELNEVGPSTIGAAREVAMKFGFENFGHFLNDCTKLLNEAKEGGVFRPVVYPLSSNQALTKDNVEGRETLKLRLKLRNDSTNNKDRDDIKIRLSSSAISAQPMPTSLPERTGPREDVSSFVDEAEVLRDEEWVPSGRTKVRLASNQVKSVSKRTSAPQTRPNKKPKLTSRERLFKKLR